MRPLTPSAPHHSALTYYNELIKRSVSVHHGYISSNVWVKLFLGQDHRDGMGFFLFFFFLPHSDTFLTFHHTTSLLHHTQLMFNG